MNLNDILVVFSLINGALYLKSIILNFFCILEESWIIQAFNLPSFEISVMKKLFNEYPVQSSIVYFTILALTFALGIRVLEKDNPYREFDDLFNSLYFSVITLTTVGYGDFTPVTPSGRFFSIIMMILGIININMINFSFVSKI